MSMLDSYDNSDDAPYYDTYDVAVDLLLLSLDYDAESFDDQPYVHVSNPSLLPYDAYVVDQTNYFAYVYA